MLMYVLSTVCLVICGEGGLSKLKYGVAQMSNFPVRIRDRNLDPNIGTGTYVLEVKIVKQMKVGKGNALSHF